jgi:hypothetical protein
MKRCPPKDQLEQVGLLLPLHERYLTIPRLALGDVFDKAGVDVCDIAGYKVALTEACRSLIHYSYRHLEPHRLQVLFTTESDQITILSSVGGECYCTEQVKTHPVLHHQAAVEDLDLLFMASLVDNYRTGLSRYNGECIAFIEITKFLGAPSHNSKRR